MNGGYYRYDLGEGVSVISLNSILMNTKNDKGESQSVKDQLAWLEAQLKDESRRFILQMHIPPGHWYQLGEDTYWKDEYMASYLGVISNASNVLLMMSAHAHPGEVRAPVSSRYPNLALPIVMNPSVSPIGLMMPSYAILEIPKADAPKIIWRSLDLLQYYMTQLPIYTTTDLQA